MGWLTKIVAKLVGKKLSDKLKLQEGKMEDSKKWYKSKAVWSGVLAVIFGAYDLVGTNLAPQFGWTLPQIPAWIFTILGAMGVYGRVKADTKIG